MKLRTAVVLSLSLLCACSLLVDTAGYIGFPADAGIASDSSVVEAGEDAGSDADAAPPALPGLIGSWSFDDLKDQSPKGHDLVLRGTARIVAGQGLNGGSGLVLDGDYDGYAKSDLAFPLDGTLSVWFRWTSQLMQDQHSVFDWYDSERPHLFIRHANGAPSGEMQVAYQYTNNYAFDGYVEAPRETWTHVVITWSTTDQRGAVYANDVLIHTDDYTARFSPTSERVEMGVGWIGAIDEVKLFDRVLPEAEIKALR